jgi:C4-dicarboxylate-specific signal transduction histidine kinase
MRLAYPDLNYRQEVIHNWSAAMERALRERGSVEQAEYRVRSKDGHDLQMLISAVVLNDLVLIALIDVTRSRQAEQSLRQALERERSNEEQLRKAIEAKLQVSLSASAVAHEISQPLGAILLNSKLALRNLDRQDPDPDGLRTFLEPLVGEAERMDLITNRIRMLLRNVETRLEPLNLSDVVTSALLQMGLPLRESGVELCNGVTSQPWLVMGDAVQLQMALVNLLRNGLEALEQACITHPRMALTVRPGNGCIALVLADNGPGFPEGFDPQIPLSSTKSTGTGIGLYVVRLTMENHGGSLGIGRSSALGGAEVVLQLPQADQEETAP